MFIEKTLPRVLEPRRGGMCPTYMAGHRDPALQGVTGFVPKLTPMGFALLNPTYKKPQKKKLLDNHLVIY